MPSYTTNYNLHKIELSDKPADITVINPNWDFIDQMLKTLEESASGAFITAEDLHTIEKTSIVQADSNTLNTPYKDSLTSATNGTCVVSVTGNNKTLFYICTGVTNPVYIQSCINGVWNSWKTIIDDAYVTIDQLENYVPKSEKGAVNGVAELDSTGKVPSDQLPAMNYVPTSEKGVADGVATLDSTGRLPESQLPLSVGEDIEAVGKQLSSWWLYLKENLNYTCDMPSDTSTKPYSYTETVKEGETVKGTLVTTMNADGTYTEVYTIGEAKRTRTWSKVDNQWKGVWS